MGRRGLRTLVAVLLAGLWGACLGLVHLNGEPWFLDRIESTMADLRTNVRGARKPPPIVLIVAIDDETARQEGKYPVSRGTLARIVDEVAQFSPKALALDILLLDAGDEAEDIALTEALARHSSVIASAAVFDEARQTVSGNGGGALAGLPVADSFALPLDRFLEKAAVGVVNVSTDYAGAPRFVPMVFQSGDRIQASFPLQVASVAMNAKPVFEPGKVVIGDRMVSTDIGQRLPIGYYGPTGTIETVSAATVLGGDLSREQVEGRVVVIGATVIGSGDVFPTPFDPVLPGVEVISTAISHLVAGDGPIRDRSVRLIDFATAVLLPMAVVGLLAWRRSAVALAAIAAIAILWLAVNVTMFSNGIWLSAAVPIAAAVPPAIIYGAAQLWLDRRRAQRFARQNELLRRFQSPALRDWLARNPNFLSEPVRQEAAIVFIDLSGFTTFSEVSSAAVMRELLDDFYRLVEQDAQAHKGVITNFMGDGAMIVFGLPEPTPDDPTNALRCAAALAAHARAWLDRQPITVTKRIGIKLGAHCGSIVASRLGGGSQQQITATGDSVNVASRLMEVAAENGADVALSADLYRAAGDQVLPLSGRLQGPVQTRIRGRSSPMSVWLWRDQQEMPAGT
jgi:adenylate cyclase